jgi:Zn-dependent M28 family amino/carboxypeptidase
MIASPNYMLSTYDGDGSKFGNRGPKGSSAIEAKFHETFKAMGIKSTEAELNGRSDYAAFADAGIPVGGIDTGADELKTEEQAVLFGGTAGVAYDSCYHQACDDMSNLSLEALKVNSNVLMAVMSDFADTVETVKSEK